MWEKWHRNQNSSYRLKKKKKNYTFCILFLLFSWIIFPRINLSLCYISYPAIPKYTYQSILLTLCFFWAASRLHPHRGFTTGKKPRREVCRWKGMKKFPNNLFCSGQVLIPCPPPLHQGPCWADTLGPCLQSTRSQVWNNDGWTWGFGSVTGLGKIKNSSNFIRMNSPIPIIELVRFFLFDFCCCCFFQH